jgi:hypothetical protein
MLLSLVCGIALGTLELLGPTLFADLSGSTTGGSAVFGVVMALSFLAGAAGSSLAPRSRRLARGSTPCAVAGLTLLSGLCLLGVAGAARWCWPPPRTPASTWRTLPRGRCCTPCCTAGSERPAGDRAVRLQPVADGRRRRVGPAQPAARGGRRRPAAYVTAGVVCALAALLALRLPGSRDEDASADEALHHEHDLVGAVLGRDPGAGGQQPPQVPSWRMPSPPAGIVAP